MQYTNKQIAEQLKKLIEQSQSEKINSSFSNGTMVYNGEKYTIPTENSLTRKTYLSNR